MNAQRAREITEAAEVDLSFITQEIKAKALEGYDYLLLNNLSVKQLNKLVELGYKVTNSLNEYCIRW